jgi:hypothetical protein
VWVAADLREAEAFCTSAAWRGFFFTWRMIGGWIGAPYT